MKYTNKSNGHTGDVELFSIDTLPSTAKKITNTPVAYGETSGHIHVITGDVELFQDEKGDYFAKTGKGKSWSQHTLQSGFKDSMYNSQEPITVADHLPCELLPETIYHIGIQKQYDPYEKVWDKVID
jgi:hypothetical protein